MYKYIIFSLLCIFGCVFASGQESRTQVCVEFRIGSSVIDPSIGDNAEALSRIVSLLERAGNDSLLLLTEVKFSGAASPDGRATFNKKLAKARMAALETYVRKRVHLPDSIVRRAPYGIAWQLLAELVEASDMPRKHEALNVLHNVPEAVYDSRGRLVDSRKKQLMELRGGRTWRYMDKHFFGKLRNACTVVVEIKAERIEPIAESLALEGLEADSREILTAQPALARSDWSAMSAMTDSVKPFYMALKTNMLFDVLALPNLGAEFYLGKGWSISGNWTYAWWDSDKRHRYWRAYGGELALRKWFGPQAARKPLTGHHVGLYGQLLTYDFEFGGEGQMAGEPGKPLWSEPSYAAGIEYGYSLPIGSRLNIDFAVGIGYLGGTYYKYKPIDGHYVWQGTSRRHWFGPTKAEISLVWLLGRGNVNAKKGGGK